MPLSSLLLFFVIFLILWTIACFEIVVFLCSSSMKNTTKVQAKQSGHLWTVYWKLLQSCDLKRNRFNAFAMRVEHSQKAAVRSWRYYHYCTYIPSLRKWRILIRLTMIQGAITITSESTGM